jgi:pyruvate formate lyase activating enzyme
MIIKGLQETTLIDYPGKISCILFLCGCNFRCGFCHNPELVLTCGGDKLSEEEVLDFLERRKNQLDGVCITGGEPLLTITNDFLVKIKELGYSIKIDTNGTCPERLKELISEGLVDFVSMDVKSHHEKYNEVSGVEFDIAKIEESMKIISSMLEEYEFRTTILKKFHDYDEMKELAEWISNVIMKKPKKYCLQGFKNQGKLLDSSFKEEENVYEDYLEELKDLIQDYFEEVEVRI